MPAWIAKLLSLAQLVPGLIALIEQIIAAIEGHPSGVQAGVEAMKSHFDLLKK